MPQLMPLGWVFSTIMIGFAVMVMLILYYESEVSLELMEEADMSGSICWVW